MSHIYGILNRLCEFSKVGYQGRAIPLVAPTVIQGSISRSLGFQGFKRDIVLLLNSDKLQRLKSRSSAIYVDCRTRAAIDALLPKSA